VNFVQVFISFDFNAPKTAPKL